MCFEVGNRLRAFVCIVLENHSAGTKTANPCIGFGGGSCAS